MGLILFIAVGAYLSYLVWTAIPPSDVIGSKLSGFDDHTRKSMMIKAEDDQDYDLFRETK